MSKTASRSQYKTKIFNRIDEVEANEWDKVSTNVFTKHACLKIMETLGTIQINPRYIAVFKEGTILGSAALYIEEKTEYYTLEESVYGPYYKFFKPLGLGLNPCLISYIPIGTIFKSIEVEQNLNSDHQEEVYQLMVDSIEKIAKDEGICVYGVLCVKEEDRVLRKVLLKNHFFPKFSSYAVYLDVIWNSFDNYLHSLKKKRRNSIRRELSHNKQQNIISSHTTKLNGYKEDSIRLFNENFFKYQHRESKINSDFILSIEKHLENTFGVFIDQKDNQIVSCVMYFKWKKIISLFKVGQNSQLSKGNFSLFNVTFYEPIKKAIEEGYNRIYLGSGPYYYKVRRGATLQPMYMYIKSTSPIKQIFLNLMFPILSRIKLNKHKKMIHHG